MIAAALLITLPPTIGIMSVRGVMDELHPELDPFTRQFLHYKDGGLSVSTSAFKRADGAALYAHSGTFPSADARIGQLKEFRRRTSAFVPYGTSNALHNGAWSGIPLGDSVGGSHGGQSKAMILDAGAETAMV